MACNHKNNGWKIFWRLLVFFCLGLGLWSLRPVHHILHTNMNDLLPSDQSLTMEEKDKLFILKQTQEKQILLLVGGENPLESAAKIADLWQQSGLFTQVSWQQTLDFVKLKESYQQLTFRVLPPEVRERLLTNPASYFAERAEGLVNPFSPSALLPLSEDWLGLSRFSAINTLSGKLQWQPDGTLSVTDDTGQLWLLVSAELEKGNGVIGDEAVLHLLQQTEEIAPILATGSAIFAAEGKVRGEKEGRLMTLAGLSLTLLLAVGIFRRWRIVWVLLPIVLGGGLGFLATVAICGGVHILTLVIASSLVGLLLDFPLHWLGKSIFPHWQAGEALITLRRPFFISLLITLFGYAFLLVTDLPILRQTAVFSLFALPTAWFVTIWILPLVFNTYQPRENKIFAALSWRVLSLLQHCKGVIALGLLVMLVVLTVEKIVWSDDIRQWVNVPPKWLEQTEKFSLHTGVEPATQIFLLHGKDDEDLLALDAQLTERLDVLKNTGKIKDYNSLSQWVLSEKSQKYAIERLREIAENPHYWEKMTKLGIAPVTMKNALLTAANAPISLAESLQSPLAMRWQSLYLGNHFAVVQLFGVSDGSALAAIEIPQVRFIDQRQHINALFVKTRNEALWLKAASYGLAVLVLLLAGFSWQRAGKIIAVPFAAAILTVSVLTLLQIPMSLFVAFGLLLISAIGIDYAVYASSAVRVAEYHFAGMLLAALTTITTFGILAFSSTPAVAAFGLTVAIGIGFSLLFATWLLPPIKN